MIDAYIKEIGMDLCASDDNPKAILVTVDCWVELTKPEFLSVVKQLTQFAEDWEN